MKNPQNILEEAILICCRMESFFPWPETDFLGHDERCMVWFFIFES